MEFEYDPSKSRLNELKHGISFDEAKALWDDPNAIIAPTKATGEERFLIVGEIEGKRLDRGDHLSWRNNSDHLSEEVANNGDRGV
jgi:uncharacterized DUF497 family protein